MNNWYKLPRLMDDLPFIYVFGDVDGKASLITMVNAFFGEAHLEPIVDLQYRNTHMGPLHWPGKSVRMDIVVKDSSDRLIDVEIQTYHQKYLLERSLFYWSRLYTKQLLMGHKYERLRPVICLNILEKPHFRGDSWYNLQTLQDTDHLTILSIELSKLPKIPLGDLKPGERWGTFIVAAGRDPKVFQELIDMDPGLKLAAQRYEMFRQGLLARLYGTWESMMDKERDIQSAMDSEKEYAREEGLAEGKAQGWAEGKAEIARRMKAKGLDTDFIAETTGLSSGEIDTIQL